MKQIYTLTFEVEPTPSGKFTRIGPAKVELDGAEVAKLSVHLGAVGDEFITIPLTVLECPKKRSVTTVG